MLMYLKIVFFKFKIPNAHLQVIFSVQKVNFFMFYFLEKSEITNHSFFYIIENKPHTF